MLGWADRPIVARVHATGASLALAAPVDQLFTATEINEFAWARGAARTVLIQHAPGHAAAWDDDCALHTIRAMARAERDQRLAALVAESDRRGVGVLIDDESVSVGSGTGARIWPKDALPEIELLEWPRLHDIPTVLVTGSNGKTTCVRLLAAMTRAHGWHTAHSCTDGLYIDGEPIVAGDYSGPAGARTVLRHAHAQAAILETARGGILRRGIAPSHARAAIVTNISDDHFGEYGVHSLVDLGAVKLAVARVVDADGLLVLNAEDSILREHAASLGCPLGWFARDDDDPTLRAHRAVGGVTAGVRDGRLSLAFGKAVHDLGVVVDMPLTFGGRAAYNIANVAAVSLAASALGIAPQTIAAVLARFGADSADNPGRLQHWQVGGAIVLLDYAHNPDGLRALLEVANSARAGGDIVLLLGQAGNRGDAEIRELARVANAFDPRRIVLKDIAGMLRGRAVGEVPAILRDALIAAGFEEARIVERLDEVDAARAAIESAQAGDVVVLPIHARASRAAVVALLDGLSRH